MKCELKYLIVLLLNSLRLGWRLAVDGYQLKGKTAPCNFVPQFGAIDSSTELSPAGSHIGQDTVMFAYLKEFAKAFQRLCGQNGVDQILFRGNSGDKRLVACFLGSECFGRVGFGADRLGVADCSDCKRLLHVPQLLESRQVWRCSSLGAQDTDPSACAIFSPFRHLAPSKRLRKAVAVW